MSGQLTTQAIKDIQQIFDLEDHHAFAIWALSTFHYESDLSESTLREIYSQTYELLQDGGPGDQCLDGYYYDQDIETLYLYQIKDSTRSQKKHGVRDAREVALALNSLLSDIHSLSLQGTSRENVIKCLKKVIEDNGQVVLRAVSSTSWSSFSDEDILNNVDSSIRKICRFEKKDKADIEDLASRASENLSGTTIRFKLYDHTHDAELVYPDRGVLGLGEARVFLLEGQSLGEEAKKYSSRLFDKNVRTFLGKGRVNKEIIRALQSKEEREKFWYAHNGITMLCDSLSIVETDHARYVDVTNPQIVNGCQTASSIGQAVSEGAKHLNDVAVLARVIQLKGTPEEKDDAAGHIAFGTNNQSPINEADLRANDPTQKFYEKILSTLPHPWFYERKRNGWKNLKKNNNSKAALFKESGAPYRVINRDEYQQAWRAFDGKPAASISDKNSVWKKSDALSGGLYEKVFSRDRRPEEVILVSVLFNWFLEVFKSKEGNSLCIDINKTLGRNIAHLSQAKTLVAAHSLAMFGLLIKREYGDSSKIPKEKLLGIISCIDRGPAISKHWGQKHWAPIGEEMRLIMSTWSNYCIQINNSNESLYRELKKESAFESLTELLENAIESTGVERHFSSL